MRFLTLLIIVFINSVCCAQQAEFSFEHKSHRWPNTAEGPILEHVFQFTNKGEIPLIIESYDVACTCTKVIYPKTPILPGESGEIQVNFDTKGKIAWQNRTILIHSNSKSSPDKLRIKVQVENP